MRIVFLTSARVDLQWFRRYYESVFPQGAEQAKVHYHRTLTLLREHPFAGRPTMVPGERQLTVPKTPFFVVYRVADEQIEVLHIEDGRSNRAPGNPAGQPDRENDAT
ncbi:MAG: hypothetical protein DI629_00385 [Mesorhizobium amorphae]|nr:MAG: hypothetical protein DI629_00385 [Mesorhizobium amorphae]